ncbi:MAG: glycoside hydrolase domain-containing protein [Odoribacter splanchnicus]
MSQYRSESYRSFPTISTRVGLVFGLSRSGPSYSLFGALPCFSQPNLFNDCYGTYCGADGKNYEALGRDTCTIFSLCDTYRTAYPLYTLLQTECAPDPVNTMLEFIPNKAFGATPEYCSVEC